MRTEKIGSHLGRTLVSAIFISGGINKFTHREDTKNYMRSKNIPLVSPLAIAAGVLEAGAGASLLLNLKKRWTAGTLAAYLVPITLIFHNFWKEQGEQRQHQQINFLKNLAIIGGLLALDSEQREERRSVERELPSDLELREIPDIQTEREFDIAMEEIIPVP